MTKYSSVFDVVHCRICGCTDADCSQCIAKIGHPCHWVEPDLCSACASSDAACRRKVPKPTPHARKRPNLTIEQLEALKTATGESDGRIRSSSGICRALFNRGLARRDRLPKKTYYYITDSGRLLIQTQYAALKAVLPETRTGKGATP